MLIFATVMCGGCVMNSMSPVVLLSLVLTAVDFPVLAIKQSPKFMQTSEAAAHKTQRGCYLSGAR